MMLAGLTAWCQAPGTAPVKISTETQMLHGRKYYVHIVEKGQTVYSISKAYKVESYDAVTHVDIHFLHPGDTVWLPARGQFPANIEVSSPSTPTTKGVQSTQNTQSTKNTQNTPKNPPAVKKTGKVIRMAVMMPLHLDQMEDISTTKFDVEQRGK